MALDGNERKALYRNLINDPATQTETKKYSFTDWERKLLGDEKAIGKLAQFSVGRNWAIDENDFVERYAPELKAPPTKKAATIPPVGIAAPVAEPAPSMTDMARQMAFQPPVQEAVEPIGVMAPPAVQEPIPSITETAREMAFKPPVQPQKTPEQEWDEMSFLDKTGQTATEAISGFNRALLKTPSSIVKTASELGVGVLNMLGGNMESEDAVLYSLADKYDKWLDTSETARKFVGKPEYTGLAANVGSGLGQVVSMIAAGPQGASKALLSTPTVLKAVSQKMFSKPSLIAFSQVFNSEFENMKAKGESEQTAFNQGLANALATSPLENLPLINLAERLNKTIGVKLARRVLNAIQQGVEEGGQEAVQQIFSNLTNNQLVESEENIVDWAQGIQPSAEAGGIVGLLIGGLANAKAARKYSKKPAAAPGVESIPAEEVQGTGYRTAYAKTREEIPVEYRNNVAEIERATTPLGRFGPMEKVFAYRVPTETIDITPQVETEKTVTEENLTEEQRIALANLEEKRSQELIYNSQAHDDSIAKSRSDQQTNERFDRMRDEIISGVSPAAETAPVAEEVPFEEVPPVTEEAPLTEEANVAPLTEEELAQIEETELTPEEEAALLAEEETAPAPAEEEVVSAAPVEEAAPEATPIASEIEKQNTFTLDSIKTISDGTDLQLKGKEALDPDIVAQKLRVGDEVTFFAERERKGVWDGKMIKEVGTNNPWGITGILSDPNGFIRNDTKINEQAAPEAPAAPAPKGRKKKEAPVTPAPAAAETKFKPNPKSAYYISKGVDEVYYTLREIGGDDLDVHVMNLSKDLNESKRKAKELIGEDVEFDEASLGRDYKKIKANKTGKGQQLAKRLEGEGVAGTLSFGKYYGKTIDEVFEIDPSYILYLNKERPTNTVFQKGVRDNQKIKEFIEQSLADKEQQKKNLENLTEIGGTKFDDKGVAKAIPIKGKIKYINNRMGPQGMYKVYIVDTEYGIPVEVSGDIAKYADGNLEQGTELSFTANVQKVGDKFKVIGRKSEYTKPAETKEGKKAEAKKEETRIEQSKSRAKDSKDAQTHSADLSGEAYELEDGTGLVQGFNLMGKPVYSGYKKGKRTRVDIDSYTGDVFTAEELSALKELKKELEASEKAAQTQDPFKKQGRVAKTDSVPENVRKLVEDITKSLGIDKKIIIITDGDFNEGQYQKHGLYGTLAQVRSAKQSASNPYEYGAKRYMSDADAFYIYYDGKLKGDQLFTVISHELGHIVEQEVFNNSSEQTKKSVKEDYEKWLASLTGKTVEEVAKETRDITLADLIEGNTRKFDASKDRYISSFSEYFADNVSKWARTSAKPKSAVDKYFSGIVEAFKKLHDYVFEKGLYSKSLFDWLDGMYEAEPTTTPEFTSSQSSEAATAFDKAKTSKGFDKKHGKGAYKALSDITKNFDDIMDNLSDKIKQDCL
jgi:hypothetical protein